MKTDILNKATRVLGKAGLQIKKHSPEILIAAGTVGVVASAVMACKATTKLSTVLEESKENIDTIHAYVEDNGYSEQYNEEDKKKDLTITYVQTGVKLAKLYAPSVALGVLSLTAIISSHNILNRRNVALTAAYATLETGFKDYRGRVIERFGKELDKELKYGIKAKEVEETIVDAKGKEKTVKKSVNVIDPNDISDYSRIFYDGNPGYVNGDPTATMYFLKCQQAHANDKLKRRGYLFLNEVYEMLGFSQIPDGQLIGWIYDEKNPVGDNFVDFGLFDTDNPATIRFVNGDENAVLLQFNHDGIIYNQI